MKKIMLSSVLISSLILGNLIAQPAIQLGFDFSKPGVKISNDLYGIFFEDINFAADGGIYAELIRNRSFDDGVKYWTLVSTNGSKGSMALQTTDLLNSVQKKCLMLQADSVAAGGCVGVQNSGFWGINVTDKTEYKLSFFAKASKDFNGVITAALTDVNGTVVYAQQRVSDVSKEWKKYTCSLVASGNDPAAIFFLSVNGGGIVSFDVVSLFPPTYKNRPNGMRIDLVQKLIDMHPKVMRFPGGSFVNGLTTTNRFLWKKTIGNIEDRSAHDNQWGYKTTNGMGLHEFLQLSEDLGATPLYVFNCGISNNNFVPYDQLDTVIEYEIAAIEYANGPITSKYGAMRAANGHPEPFNLKYVEVGNESNQPSSNHYGDRYIQFYNAIRAKYPDLVIIGDLAWGTDVPTWDYAHPVDLIDEHFYRTPEWYLINSERYDLYSRTTGYKIYIGEYAVTTEGGKGNLAGALGEAAYMTGIERNGDLIPLAAYAPLFGNINKLHWFPDLIYFNSSFSFGTPSYYVQKLFANNIGTKYVPNTCNQGIIMSDTVYYGAIGVGSTVTKVQYDSISVISGDSVIIDEKFDNNAVGWNVVSGTWSVTDGVYQQTGTTSNCRSTFGKITMSKYTIKLKALKTSGNEGFLIIWGCADKKNYYCWNLGGVGNTQASIQHCVNGVISTYIIKANKITGSQWYNIRIDVEGDTARCFLDNDLMFTYQAVDPKKLLYTSCTVDSANGDIYIKAINYSDGDKLTNINLNNMPPNTKLTGTVDVLTHNVLATENTVSAPNTVVPVTSKFSTDATTFDYTFKAHSLTVFHLYLKSATLQAADTKFTFPENSANSTKVGTITATGAGKYKYAILSSSIRGAFTINDSTGDITVKDNQWLNFERDTLISLTISVKDADHDSVIAARCISTVSITDVNEKPVLLDNTYYVFKNETVGTVLGTIFVNDEDKSQAPTFSIKSQSSGSLLQINSSTGKLTLAALPGSVAADSITFVVDVTDNGSPALTDEKEYTLKIMDNPTLVTVRPIDKANSFSITPNPATNQIQIKTGRLYQNAIVKIVNVNGMVVNSLKLNQDITTINTSKLPDGLYNVQLICNDKIIGNSNVVVQR
jgi:alpha-L-arabinofuranosidase